MKGNRLDGIHVRVLSALQGHGSLSKARLTEIAGLSPTPCWARLRTLEAAGFVRGYHADIALGEFTQVVVTVALTHHRKSDFERFERYIHRTDEVIECIATGGGMDYALKVVSTSLVDFQRLMEALLDAELGIERYMAYIVTREVKSRPPNLARLLARSGR